MTQPPLPGCTLYADMHPFFKFLDALKMMWSASCIDNPFCVSGKVFIGL